MIIDNINKLELHDCPIDSLNIDFSNKKINLSIDVFNEKKKNYDKANLSFLEIEDLSIEVLNIDNLSDIDIDYHEVFEKNNKYFIKFILRLGFGKSTAKISFAFKDFSKSNE